MLLGPVHVRREVHLDPRWTTRIVRPYLVDAAFARRYSPLNFQLLGNGAVSGGGGLLSPGPAGLRQPAPPATWPPPSRGRLPHPGAPSAPSPMAGHPCLQLCPASRMQTVPADPNIEP